MQYLTLNTVPHHGFWNKVEITDGCWLWLGKPTAAGYGSFTTTKGAANGKKTWQAHVYAYEDQVGPVPDGLHLDHLCHNEDLSCPGGPTCIHRRCVNPAHLEPVTHAENVRRGRSGQAQRARTHCPRGHEYSGANLYIRTTGARTCRACQRLAQTQYTKRKRAS